MDTLAICRQERKKREPIPVNDAVRAYRQGECSIESVRIITSAAAGPLAYSVGWRNNLFENREQAIRAERLGHRGPCTAHAPELPDNKIWSIL